MKVVLDTNVLVSALARPGRLARLPELWMDQRIQLLMAEAALAELQDVLCRPHLGNEKSDVDKLLNHKVVPYLHPVQPFLGSLPHPCKDPDDDLFLRIALSGSAQALVTGDKELLALEGHYPFKILKPATFLDQHFPDFMAGETLETQPTKKKRRARAKRSPAGKSQF